MVRPWATFSSFFILYYPVITMESSSQALSLGVTLAVALVGLTAFSLYTAFGPPAKDLEDPFDDHDD